MKRVFGIISLVCLLHQTNCVSNNVCPTFSDYYTIRENENCWYNFIANSSATEIIQQSGYPLEVHKVTTKDGYILTVYRIPKEGAQPVFLLHGVACTASNFLALGKNALAFVLSDAGYDVWLGNLRGTEYSEGHVNLTVYDKKYWDHSIDELEKYDVPAMLQLVASKTGNHGNIIYIGHSLATTLALMYGSENAQEAKAMVKLFILLSPSYKLTNMKSPYRYIRSMLMQMRQLAGNLKGERLLQQAEPARRITRHVCLESPELMRLCLQAFNMFFGRNTQMGPEMVPVFFNQLPGGGSLKVFNHIAQQISGQFAKYDYGKENINIYGQSTPPEYNISKIEVPFYLVYSTADWATTKKDALILYNALPEKAKYGRFEVRSNKFNHIDFVFGRYAKEEVYNHLLEVMRKNRKP